MTKRRCLTSWAREGSVQEADADEGMCRCDSTPSNNDQWKKQQCGNNMEKLDKLVQAGRDVCIKY